VFWSKKVQILIMYNLPFFLLWHFIYELFT
jgi:hypothetical protein